MKYAIFTVSAPTMTPEEIAAAAHQYGYEGIVWRVVDEAPNPLGMGWWHGNKTTIPATGFAEHVDRLKKLATDNELEMPSLGTYVNCLDDWAAIEHAFASAKALGVPSVRVNSPGYSPDQPALPLWQAAREGYRKVAELAGKTGIRALVETHMNTLTPSATAARMLLDGLDPANVGVIYDNGNMVFEGFEQYRLGLELLGPYLDHVHIKNAKWFPVHYREDRSLIWKCQFAEVPTGSSDIWAVCRALLDIGYDGWITFEDFSAMKPLETRLEKNILFVKDVFERMKAEAAAPTE